MTTDELPCRRLFVLLTWSPAAGAAVDPVGVLALDHTLTGLESAVSWVPLTYGAAAAWRHRIATVSLTEQVLQAWLEDGGAGQLSETTHRPLTGGSLRAFAEAAMDHLLTGQIWTEG